MQEPATPNNPALGPSTDQVLYEERLWPSVGVWVIVLGVSLAGILVFAPLGLEVGYIGAVVLAAILTILLLASTPRIVVTARTVQVGRAQIDRTYVGEVGAYTGAEATAQRGPVLHGLAFVCFRGWISPVVRMEITDEADRTPYWLTSTRRPQQLVAALTT